MVDIGPVAFNIMVMSTDVSTVAAMAEFTDDRVQNCAIFAETGKRKSKSIIYLQFVASSTCIEYMYDVHVHDHVTLLSLLWSWMSPDYQVYARKSWRF